MEREPEFTGKTLQIQHKDSTKRLILEWAMHLIVAEKQTSFSHESVATAAGISARTVYRHFPSRDELIASLWVEFQAETSGNLPQTEEELLQKTVELYSSFDRYDGLVRAYLGSPASQNSQSESLQRDRQVLGSCLEKLTGNMDEEHRIQVVGAFSALYSPQAWQRMRDGAGLSGPQAARAAQLAMAAVMEALRPQSRKKSESESPEPQEKTAPGQSPATPAPSGQASHTSGKWKGVYDNPLVARFKKLMPKE